MAPVTGRDEEGNESTAAPVGPLGDDLVAAAVHGRASLEYEYRRQVARYRRGGLLQLIAEAAARESGPSNLRETPGQPDRGT